MEVEDDIDENLKQHEPCIVIDYDELINFPDIDEFDGEDESDFKLANPNLIGFQPFFKWRFKSHFRLLLNNFTLCALNSMMLKSISLVSL